MKERYKFVGRSGDTYIWKQMNSRPGTVTHKKCDVEWFWNPWRTWWKDLGILEGGRDCETCGHAPINHVWMDLDEHGFAFNCSIKEMVK